jgi:uncharacterized membrane protein
MSDPYRPSFKPAHEGEGKPAALIAWGLYILSIPSANVLVLVGLIVAYGARGTATGLPRQHIEAQIALFWSVFWWTIATWVLIVISGIASIALIGIPFLFLFLAVWFLLGVWFTVKSVLGLVALADDRPPV